MKHLASASSSHAAATWRIEGKAWSYSAWSQLRRTTKRKTKVYILIFKREVDEMDSVKVSNSHDSEPGIRSVVNCGS
jgi:hypothetical protein